MRLRERISRLLFPAKWKLIDGLQESIERLDLLLEKLDARE